MSDEQARRLIVQIGKKMYQRQFVAANDGNISCRVGANEIWTTPTGVSKGDLDEGMLVKTDMTGKCLEGTYRPSSELKMHLALYRENSEIMGVVHAHPPVATAFAAIHFPLDIPVMTEAIIQLGSVPVTEFALPGSQELADSVVPYSHSSQALLLANHGALTWGKSLQAAYFNMETLEQYALVLSHLGYLRQKTPVCLNQDQIESLELIALGMGLRFNKGANT